MREQIMSPFPPPAMLREYGELHDSLPTRLIEHIERQSRHRQDMERRIANAQIEDAQAQRAETRMGQVLGFCAVALALLIAAAVTMEGHPGTGSVIGGGSLIGLASAFFFTAKRAPQGTPESGTHPAKKEDQHGRDLVAENLSR